MAKKSKGFGELLKQQQAEQYQQSAFDTLGKKIQSGPLGRKFAGVVANPKGEVKMSEVLEAFVEPYLDAVRNHTQREKLFAIAVVAWNLALLPQDERQPLIDQVIQQGLTGNDPLAQQGTREIIDELIARKETLFTNNQRFIVEFQLQDKGKNFHLSVASTLMKQRPNPEQSHPEAGGGGGI